MPTLTAFNCDNIPQFLCCKHSVCDVEMALTFAGLRETRQQLPHKTITEYFFLWAFLETQLSSLLDRVEIFKQKSDEKATKISQTKAQSTLFIEVVVTLHC